MTEYAHLWLFFAVVLGVIILPGMDMAFVMGSTLAGGRRRGMLAVAGIVAGGICHVSMTVLGISVLLRAYPWAFNLLLAAGTLYIAYIGFTLSTSRPSRSQPSEAPVVLPRGRIFRQAALTALLNPKAYLFMLAIFPQFLRPSYGSIGIQAVVLWAIIAATQLAVYGALALTADRLREVVQRRGCSTTGLVRGVGIVLILAAVATGFESWRRFGG